ncbi:MAG: hypothetical protein QW196_01255 [Sulfolobales archaeon]
MDSGNASGTEALESDKNDHFLNFVLKSEIFSEYFLKISGSLRRKTRRSGKISGNGIKSTSSSHRVEI